MLYCKIPLLVFVVEAKICHNSIRQQILLLFKYCSKLTFHLADFRLRIFVLLIRVLQFVDDTSTIK